MKNWGKALLILVVIGAFVVPTFIATRYVSLWYVCRGYIETVSNVTGLNTHLTAAGAALLFVPFLIGVRWTLSWKSERRQAGEAILLGLFVLYNLGLFFGTQHAYFGFSKGDHLKWYAITRDGVQLFDRPGVDPRYGIALKPVTPDIVEQLELIRNGQFRRIEPTTGALFDYLTGKPSAWYWRDTTSGEWEFYSLPGFHPRTGDALLPVTKVIYSEWQRAMEKRAKQQAAADAAARQEQEARQAAETARIAQAYEEAALREQQERETAEREKVERIAAAEAEVAARRADAAAREEDIRAQQKARQEAWEQQDREMRARMQANVNELRKGLSAYQNRPPQNGWNQGPPNQGYGFRFKIR